MKLFWCTLLLCIGTTMLASDFDSDEFGLPPEEPISKLDELIENIEKMDQSDPRVREARDLMVANIDKLLERGDKLELLVDKTRHHQTEAFVFKKESARLKPDSKELKNEMRRLIPWKNRRWVRSYTEDERLKVLAGYHAQIYDNMIGHPPTEEGIGNAETYSDNIRFVTTEQLSHAHAQLLANLYVSDKLSTADMLFYADNDEYRACFLTGKSLVFKHCCDKVAVESEREGAIKLMQKLLTESVDDGFNAATAHRRVEQLITNYSSMPAEQMSKLMGIAEALGDLIED